MTALLIPNSFKDRKIQWYRYNTALIKAPLEKSPTIDNTFLHHIIYCHKCALTHGPCNVLQY